MNTDNREQRVEHARMYLIKTLKQDILITIGVVIFATLSISALIINSKRLYPENTTFVWVILFLCIGLLWVAFDKIPRHIKHLQDVDGNLEEIERIESEAKQCMQKNKSTSSSSVSYGGNRSIADLAYGEHGWRKTIPHSEYTKYHIKLEDYETYFEYEDALRKAKNHYNRMHR